jgi:hypothetical protein
MIFEAIAAIKVANDCIATLREAASNVNSIKDIAGPLGKLVDAEETIKKKADQGDMDAFFALEDIRRERAAIREMMQWGGRGGLWEDFVRFEKTRRELRENERKRAIQKKKQRREAIKNTIIILCGAIAVLSLVGAFIMIIMWLNKG